MPNDAKATPVAIEPEGDWYGLYKGSTSRDDHLFEPASVRHPAKMSLALTNKILDTMQEWGWIETGSLVVDPFGGRGTTALCWLARNAANRALTVELEPHFVEMQNRNKEHAERRLHRELAWVILQGDSRRFAEYYAEGKAASVLSAPYENDLPRGACGGEKGRGGDGMTRLKKDYIEPSTPGQIGNLPDSAITSAPYENSITDAKPGIDMSKSKRLASGRKDEGANSQVIIGGYQRDAAVLSAPYGEKVISKVNVDRLRALTKDPSSSLYGRDPDGEWFKALEAGYINSEGNIDNLPDGDWAAAVLSAPYAAAENRRAAGKVQEGEVSDAITRAYDATNHGQTAGNIANLPDACVTSAPWGNEKGGDTPAARGIGRRDRDQRPSESDGTHHYSRGYTDPAAAVTSAPFEDSLASDDPEKRGGILKSDPKRRNDPGLTATYGDAAAVTSAPWEAQPGNLKPRPEGVVDQALMNRHGASHGVYADNQQGQIGVLQTEHYADACGKVYASLAKAGIRYVCSVTKDPVRQKRLRPLRLLTISLFEQAGYRLVAWRRAWLYHTQAELDAMAGQESLFGDEVEESKRLVGRLSFFRRLSLNRGGIASPYEDVLFFRLADPEEQQIPEKPEKPRWVRPELF